MSIWGVAIDGKDAKALLVITPDRHERDVQARRQTEAQSHRLME